MTSPPVDPHAYVRAISNSGLSIYEKIQIGDPTLWIPAPELESLLNGGLKGLSAAGLPLRTRSKKVKERICEALGYPIPPTFARTNPRFPGQDFDVYIQKSNNLQIWNEELSGTRRYVIVQVLPNGSIGRVRVVTGETLSLLDTTGTLTQKYQARCVCGKRKAELVSGKDTHLLRKFIKRRVSFPPNASPADYPEPGQILSIKEIFRRLSALVGTKFPDAGVDQERNRGAILHKLVCEKLGYKTYRDTGQFPDVRHQLLEIKLQTSPTIDLGLVTPNSVEPLDVPQIEGNLLQHREVRYAVFYAKIESDEVKLTHFFLSTGEDFFSRFPRFEGKILNRKLQIRLPGDFFDSESIPD